MTRSCPPTPAERLAELTASSSAVTYFENETVGRAQSLRMATYGVPATAEVFVVVTDGSTVRVRSFISRHKNFPADLRREEIPLVDTADACALARAMTRHWPYRQQPESPSRMHALSNERSENV